MSPEGTIVPGELNLTSLLVTTATFQSHHTVPENGYFHEVVRGHLEGEKGHLIA